MKRLFIMMVSLGMAVNAHGDEKSIGPSGMGIQVRKQLREDFGCELPLEDNSRTLSGCNSCLPKLRQRLLENRKRIGDAVANAFGKYGLEGDAQGAVYRSAEAQMSVDAAVGLEDDLKWIDAAA